MSIKKLVLIWMIPKSYEDWKMIKERNELKFV